MLLLFLGCSTLNMKIPRSFETSETTQTHSVTSQETKNLQNCLFFAQVLPTVNLYQYRKSLFFMKTALISLEKEHTAYKDVTNNSHSFLLQCCTANLCFIQSGATVPYGLRSKKTTNGEKGVLY
jgi:hypothetical protein